MVTEITDGDVGDDHYIDDVVFDHTGDAFVVGVATVSGTPHHRRGQPRWRPIPARTPHRLHHQRRTRTLNRPTPDRYLNTVSEGCVPLVPQIPHISTWLCTAALLAAIAAFG